MESKDPRCPPEKFTDGVYMRVVAGLATVPVVGDQQSLPGGPGDLLVHSQELHPGQEHGLQGGIEHWSNPARDPDKDTLIGGHWTI